jgi:hypothetical protein
MFERVSMSEEQLTELDTEAIGGLEPDGPAVPMDPPMRSLVQRMSFPSQEHKLGTGRYLDPLSAEPDPETGLPDPLPVRHTRCSHSMTRTAGSSSR